jgi:hypothetical protein
MTVSLREGQAWGCKDFSSKGFLGGGYNSVDN